MSIYDHKTLRTSTLLDEAPELDVNFLEALSLTKQHLQYMFHKIYKVLKEVKE